MMNLKNSLMFCFALIVAGCGGGSTSTDPTTSQQDSATTPVASDSTSIDPFSSWKRRTCTNGATNYPSCTICPTGKVLYGGVCTIIPIPTPTPTPIPTPVTQPGPSGEDATKWSITFQDEFDGSSLDTTKWVDHLWYIGSDATKNYSVSNGSLKIWPQPNSSGQFVDRHITTDGKFQQTYGFYEIEAKLPYGKGPWPAFWLYAHPCDTTGTFDKCRPEIDIMEAYSGGGPTTWWSDANLHPNNYGMTLHEANGDYSSHQVPYEHKMRDFSPYDNTPIDLSANWHKYGMKWEPTGITFYFDGKPMGTKWVDTSSYYNQPMYVLLSFQLGSASGTPDATTPTGVNNSFDIHYVRVWKAK